MERKHWQVTSNIRATSAEERKQRDQHRSERFNMLKRNNMRVVREDFQETPPTSVSTFSSVKSDEKLNRYVLKIDIVPPSSATSSTATIHKNHKKCSEKIRKAHISVMSINNHSQQQQQESVSVCNNKSCVMMVPSSYDGNLSDDQKLVLNITTSSDDIVESIGLKKNYRKNVNRIMLSDNFSSCGDDHLDSGTCSDADINVFHSPSSESPQPPPLPPKNGKMRHHQLSDSFYSDASSASSSDSMQYNGSSIMTIGGNHLVSPDLIRSIEDHHNLKTTSNNIKNGRVVINNNKSTTTTTTTTTGSLPLSLLMDIRSRSIKFNDEYDEEEDDDELTTTSDENEEDHELIMCNRESSDEKLMIYSEDKNYKFHINEHLSSNLDNCHLMTHDESDENFAGYKDIHSRTSTIRSAKGTIRGVKNRVRNGIKTFLLNSSTTVRSYRERDAGKIVLYTTSMGVVRSTYAKCQTVKKILKTLMLKFEERDVFMSQVNQYDIRERMQSDNVEVPQLFVDGQYIGNADQVERLNETGDLRKMLKSFKCIDSVKTCIVCGGYNMLPCPSCGGSKKSVHRNHFTAEFIALKCMNCDEVGLVKCFNCS